MPTQVKALPMRKQDYDDDDESIPMDITPEKDTQQAFCMTKVATKAAEPEQNFHLEDDDALGMDGMVDHHHPAGAIVAPQDDYQLGCWSVRPPYVHDDTRAEPVNHFLSVVGGILDANKIPLNWNRQWWKGSRKSQGTDGEKSGRY
jgi:hypothetical protein